MDIGNLDLGDNGGIIMMVVVAFLVLFLLRKMLKIALLLIFGLALFYLFAQ